MKKKRSPSAVARPTDHKRETIAFLLTPARHPIFFAVIFVPVVASIVAASIIHEFTFFYLLIPGFWCYAVGSFIINGLQDGSLTDNTGTATRGNTPFRFWVKVGIWSLAYLLATLYPLGLAFQETAQAANSTMSRQ